MAEVQERLERRFPELDATVVEAAVRLAESEITGPVRDFVPLLVERAARARLERARAGGHTDEAGHDTAPDQPAPQPAGTHPRPPAGTPAGR